MIKLKHILNEEDVFGTTGPTNDADKVEDELEDAFKDIGKEFERTDIDAKNVDEAIGLTLAGVALSAPEILKLIGKFVNLLKKIPGLKSLSGDRLIAIGDKYHHYIMGGIVKGLMKVGVKDRSKAENAANWIFHIVIALMLVAGGIAAYKFANKGQISASMLKNALNAVKGNEIKKFIVTAFAAI
jgi:hypothetical protein